MPNRKPWVQSWQDLEDLTINGEGKAVLTHPDVDKYGHLNLGDVIDWALHGPTQSFSVVVGYFNHQEHDHLADPRCVPSPADVVAREVVDERGRESDACAFRLLFGRVLTKPAAHAIWSWYWLCRWRNSPHRKEVETWRDGLLSALEDRLYSDPPPRAADLADFARTHLTEPGCRFNADLLEAGADQAKKLLNLDDGGLALFENWRSLFREVATTTPILDLLLYLIRARAAIRVDATREVVSFHPKIYVIERHAQEGRPADAIVLAGSGNWSPGAFGRTSRDHANVEVATVHRIGRLDAETWKDGATAVETSCLGAAIAATAAELY